MAYIGDFSSTATVGFGWNSYDSSGQSASAAVAGTLTVFETTSTAAAVLGLTDNRNYRGITGGNQAVIDLTATGFFAPGKDYSVILTNSSISGATVNRELAQFSIRNRYTRGTDNAALAANVAPNSSALVISAGGVVDARIAATSQTFDQVGNVLGSVVSVSSNVAGNVTGSVGSVTGNVGGNVVGSVTSVSSNVAGNVTGSVGSIAGKVLPTNSSALVITTSGVVSADAKFLAGSSTAVTQIVTNIDATISSRSTLTSSDVNLEVDKIVNQNAQAEPSGAPAATGSVGNTAALLRSALRNRIDVTASDKTFYNDAGSAIWRKALSDSGSTYTEAKGA